MINVCLNVYNTRYFLFQTLIHHRLFRNKVNLHVLDFGWWQKNPYRDNQNVEVAGYQGLVLFTVFY